MSTSNHENDGSQLHNLPEQLHGDNPTTRVLREKIWKPPNRQNNWRVFVIVGREGTGKSLTCASILERCDPDFGVDRVHFDPVDFLESISSNRTGTGNAVMIDEAGVGMGVRSWYEKEQIQLNKALQTARDDNMIIGMTLPRVEELDSQTEGRLHFWLRTVQLHKGQFCRFKFQKWDPSRDGRNKTYRENVRIENGGGQMRLDTLAIGPPSDSFVEAYEEKKAAFKSDLYDDVQEGYEEAKQTERSEQDIAAEIKENGVEEFVGVHGGNGRRYIDGDLIRMEYGLSHRKAKSVKKLLDRDDEVVVE